MYINSKIIKVMLNALRKTFPYPFYYGWLLQNEMFSAPKVLIDVGCGEGKSLKALKEIDSSIKLGKTYLIGLDIFSPYLKKAKYIYHDVIRCDIGRLPLRKSSADVALALDLIEHLERCDGLRLLSDLDVIAKSQVIIFTPVGWLPQIGYDANPWQKHRSAWFPEEFRTTGFKVIGAHGIRHIYTQRCRYRFKHIALRPLLDFIRMFTQLITYHKVHLAANMLCVKNK